MGKAEPSEATPTFENRTLAAVAAAILKRRKAIRYSSEMILERAQDRRGGIAFERLNLTLRMRSSLRIWFSFWEDSAAWVCIRRHHKKLGWTFVLELQCNVWDLTPKDIVQRIESTRNTFPPVDRAATAEDQEELRRIWSADFRNGGSRK